ncbi:hypothetical protein EDD11_009661 [Mortierella claussenii]|nr:hypothetical protein EDD11_009661 [Mortierella claussenii]
MSTDMPHPTAESAPLSASELLELEHEVRRLKQEKEALEQQISALRLEKTQSSQSVLAAQLPANGPLDPLQKVAGLTNPEIARYGRQLILPDFGIQGQLSLRNTAVLVVGAGGLGSSCALYLGGSGVGRLGIVDHDTVDISNLHRQVIHNEGRQGMSKAQSAAMSVRLLNPHCQIHVHDLVLESANAQPIINAYDIIVDATDNVATRYLLNDACVLGKKPLVSGSALRLDGQLTIYNYRGGPCYRCLFPTPPPSETVTNCSDGGVLGAYKKIRDEGVPHVLLDVREKVQFDICSLPSSLNIPLKNLPEQMSRVKERLGAASERPVYIVCRRGNDSQPAVRILQEHGITSGDIRDIVGGLEKWTDRIDPDFPKY